MAHTAEHCCFKRWSGEFEGHRYRELDGAPEILSKEDAMIIDDQTHLTLPGQFTSVLGKQNLSLIRCLRQAMKQESH